MMKKSFAILLLLCCLFKSYAQVNLQTGSATFSLPIFSWQDDKSRLNNGIALNYTSGNGLKVNDVASNVGQGWSLMAGGTIARMQVGEPDDQKAYISPGATEQTDDIKKYPAGYLYATRAPEGGFPNLLANYPLFKGQNQLYKQHNIVAEDRELDYFSFQFNGHNGMFVLNKSNDQCLFLGDTKMKAWFTRDESLINQQIRTTINGFYIQDETGLIYKFLMLGKTKILKKQYCDANQKAANTQPKFKGDKVYYESDFDNNDIVNPFIVNEWYLTEIEDALTHRKITLTYDIKDINTTAGADLSFYDKNYSIVTRKTSKTSTPKLKSIIYPDGHSVGFYYNSKIRIDVKGDKALAFIDVMYQGRFVSRHLLKTSYFILNRYGNPISDYEKSVARLCLLSVKKMSADLKADNPAYLFDYYTGSSATDDVIPPPFSFNKDIWGFYNGDYSKNADGNASFTFNTPLIKLSNNDIKGLCYYRSATPNAVALNPKPGYAKNGLLRQIIYPTGGTLSYEYEQNIGSFGTGDVNVGGVHVLKTSSTDGGYSNGCSNPIVTLYKFTTSLTSNNSSLWGLEMPVNYNTMKNHYEPGPKKYKYSFPFGKCYFKYQYPGLLALEDKVSLSNSQEILQAIAPVLNVVSTASQVLDVVMLCVSGTGWGAVIVDAVLGVYQLLSTCLPDGSKEYTTIVHYNNDLKGSNPLPVQYKRAEVVPQSGGSGRTVYEFTSSTDYPVWEPDNSEYSQKQRYAYWAYGLPKKTTVYDVNNNKVRETENVYDYADTTPCQRGGVLTLAPETNAGNTQTIQNFNSGTTAECGYKVKQSLGEVSCHGFVQKSSSKRQPDWEDPNSYAYPSKYTGQTPNADILTNIYNVYTGRVEVKKTYDRVYNVVDQSKYAETVSSYEYNYQYNYNVEKVTTTQSNGDVEAKHILYNTDILTGVYNLMSQNNITSIPIQIYSTVQKVNHGFSYKQSNVTEFTQLANGDIKPTAKLEERFDRPSQVLTIYFPGSGGFITTQSFNYDANGNLVGIKDEGNHIVTNIYDYSDKFITASVINADPLGDKPAYTSFETNATGGWVLTGGAQYAINAVTGARSLVLNNKTLTASALNTGKPYKLSFWSAGSVNISGGTASLITSFAGINGFTYYEYNIAQGASALTLSGTGNIDEVRLYPKNARMRTVTYDPLIGKTSECDENNRITYYEYDDLGRLKYVKDENRHIVKMNEYNTVSKQNGCPGVYYNFFISEVFTRDNCGEDYMGGEVTYTIPANKYTSAVSQADADAQAENELNTLGQAYANTNGSCIKLYYNDALSAPFTKESCADGYIGSTVMYAVPAKKYVSTISKDDANQMAQDEADANGQAYANLPGNGTCTIDNTPDWQTPGETPVYKCEAGKQLVYLVDVNPNSPSYNQNVWKETGNNGDCAVSTININYFNYISSLSYLHMQNLSSGGSYDFYLDPGKTQQTLAGQVPAGTYKIILQAGNTSPANIYLRFDDIIQQSGTTLTINSKQVSNSVLVIVGN